MQALENTAEYQALVAARSSIASQSISALFAEDPARFDDFSILLNGLCLITANSP